MNNYTTMLLMGLIVFCNNAVASENGKDDERQLRKRISTVQELIDQKKYKDISLIVDDLEKFFSKNPTYVSLADSFLISDEERIDKEFWPLWDRVYKIAIEIDIPSSLGGRRMLYGKESQIKILTNRYSIACNLVLLSYYWKENHHQEKQSLEAMQQEINTRMSRADHFATKTLIAERKKVCGKMLSLRKDILSCIDESWDKTHFDPDTMIGISFEEEPDLFMGAFSGPYLIFQLNPAKIKNEETRKQFIARVEAAEAKLEQARLHGVAKGIYERLQKHETVEDFLVNMYSLTPRADKELIDLLEQYEYPLEKRLLKVVAKMVSYDNRGVVLEKADGDTVSLKLTELSRKDRLFVHEQRKAEIE